MGETQLIHNRPKKVLGLAALRRAARARDEPRARAFSVFARLKQHWRRSRCMLPARAGPGRAVLDTSARQTSTAHRAFLARYHKSWEAATTRKPLFLFSLSGSFLLR